MVHIALFVGLFQNAAHFFFTICFTLSSAPGMCVGNRKMIKKYIIRSITTYLRISLNCLQSHAKKNFSMYMEQTRHRAFKRVFNRRNK